MPLQINQKAPDFKLLSTGNKEFSLSKDAANEPIILFFYPKDGTRVCTQEVCSFRDNFSFFQNLDVKVVGISTNSVKEHEHFKANHKLPFELLSDTNGKVSKAFKAKLPLLNVSKRVTYLLDKEHKIAAVYSELFGADGHIKEMIANLNE